jgi:hypothetical protein
MSSGETNTKVVISVPVGDLIDRITILEIKREFINSIDQVKNITNELNALNLELEKSSLDVPNRLIDSMREINKKIFLRMEDLFPMTLSDPDYALVAKDTVDLNITRARIKREINLHSGSKLVEEKSYFVSD